MKAKMLFLLFFFVFGSKIYPQTIVQTSGVLSANSIHLIADLEQNFTQAINHCLKAEYPSTVENMFVEISCGGDSIIVTYEAKIYESDQHDADYKVESAGCAIVRSSEFKAQKIALRKSHAGFENVMEKTQKTHRQGVFRTITTGDRMTNCASEKSLAVVGKFVIIKRFRHVF